MKSRQSNGSPYVMKWARVLSVIFSNDIASRPILVYSRPHLCISMPQLWRNAFRLHLSTIRWVMMAYLMARKYDAASLKVSKMLVFGATGAEIVASRCARDADSLIWKCINNAVSMKHAYSLPPIEFENNYTMLPRCPWWARRQRWNDAVVGAGKARKYKLSAAQCFRPHQASILVPINNPKFYSQ